MGYLGLNDSPGTVCAILGVGGKDADNSLTNVIKEIVSKISSDAMECIWVSDCGREATYAFVVHLFESDMGIYDGR